LQAAEQSRPDVAERRDEWIQRRLPRMCQEPHRLLFLDETGTTTNMTRLRGRAPCDGLVAPWVLDGPMNGEAFETYIETQLAPILARGDVVIMDNLSSHKTERVEQLIRERGAWPLFLPPYSPDLNPIEMAFAKLKELLRKLNARTIDQLWRAIGSICSLFTPDQCWNFFRHCGYANAST
jgi:transposase